MTKAQRLMLLQHWAPCAKIYRAQGLTVKEVDEKRRRVIACKLGYAKSMRMSECRHWTNPEVNAVKAAFLSISEPSNLNAQIAVIDGEEKHRGQIYADCVNLCEVVIDGHTLTVADCNYRRDRYLDTMARNTHKKPFADCTAAELAVIRGQLQTQITRQERAALKPSEGTPF